jgi:hypothetical protein
MTVALLIAASARAQGEQGISPIRWILVSVELSSQDAFFERIRDYAVQYDFDVRISRSRPDVPNFLVYLVRPDVTLIGSNPIELEVFGIGLYPQRDVTPPPIEVIDEMVESLTAAIADLDGASIIGQKGPPAKFN